MLTKNEIIARLAVLNGYRNYLEICTATTGLFHDEVQRTKFQLCRRLMYRCPDGYDDGMRIDYRSPDLDIASCLAEIRRERWRYDIILVDPWHEYDTSLRDLSEAFALIPEGGTLLVHDCLPPTEDSTNPHGIWDPKAGGWAGVTHQAYVDFVLGRTDLTYYTVDTDWGCGIIRKLGGDREPGDRAPSSPEIPLRAHPDQRDLVITVWKSIGRDHRLTYRFMREHGPTLLNLITADEFLLAAGEEENPTPSRRA